MHEIAEFFHNKKNLVTTIVLAILILSLPIGLMLVKQFQVFLPKAAGAAITVLEGECVTTKDGNKALTCGNVPLQLLSTLGASGTPPTPSPTPNPSNTPTSTPSTTPAALGPNLLQNPDFANCNSNNWNTFTVGNTVTNIATYPGGAETTGCSVSFNCNAAAPANACDGIASIYQDIAATGLGSKTVHFGGKFASTTSPAQVELVVFELDPSNTTVQFGILGRHSVIIATSTTFQDIDDSFKVNANTKTLRYQLYPKTGETFRADNIYVKTEIPGTTPPPTGTPTNSPTSNPTATPTSTGPTPGPITQTSPNVPKVTNVVSAGVPCESGGGIKISWTNPSGILFHRIDKTSDGTTWVFAGFTDGNITPPATEFIDKSGTPGSFYAYRVYAAGNTSNPGYSDPVVQTQQNWVAMPICSASNNFIQNLKLAITKIFRSFLPSPAIAATNNNNCPSPGTADNDPCGPVTIFNDTVPKVTNVVSVGIPCESGGGIKVSWTNPTSGVLFHRIDKTADGTTWYLAGFTDGTATTLGTQFIDHSGTQGVFYAYRVYSAGTTANPGYSQPVVQTQQNWVPLPICGSTSPPQCSDTLDNDNDSLIDSADPQCHSDGNASNIGSYNPGGASESEGTTTVSFTTCYRISESEVDLKTASCSPYTEHPTIINYQLKDDSPGSKQIWVRFEGFENGQPITKDEHITIALLEKDPNISGVDCTLDIAKENLKVTVKGERFGSSQGKVTANKTQLDILSWDSSSAVGLLKKPSIPLEDGQKFTIVLTTKDGKVLPEQICRVNRSLLSLGARLFCREPGKFDLALVKVLLVDETKARVEETVTIDKDGNIPDLKTKLQSGKKYVVSIKAPYSIRRNATFTAFEGTTVVSQEDGSPFILPVGDIAPIIRSDGKINSLDRSVLVSQWRVLGTSTKVLTGDFNRDTKVNSIDWACMRYDFDAVDDPIPTEVPKDNPNNPSGGPDLNNPSATPTPPPAGGPTPTSTPTSSPTVQKTAQFKLMGSTSTQVGQTFIISVNLRSDQDQVNLLKASLTFDKTIFEVESIDKTGSFISSFAEEFFDNATGSISVVGTIPTPGFKTSLSDQTMVKIVFKAKTSGSGAISFNENSRVFRNSDNQDILGSTSNITVTATN